MTIKAQTAITKAYRDLGYTESPAGSNKTKFGKWYGMDGESWCAMFVSYVLIGECNMVLPGSTTHKGFASCEAIRHAAVTTRHWVEAKNLKPGDIVLYHFQGEHAGANHTGLFVKWEKPGQSFVAIEGNTSGGDTGSQANGGGVFERHRKVGVVLGGYRPNYMP